MDCSILDFDMTISVISNNEEKIYPVHSFILNTASPVFHSMLKYEKLNSVPIRITDTEHETMDRFLKYIYRQEISFNTIDDAWSLYYLGEKYLMCELKSICLDYIKMTSTINDICFNYEQAKFYGLTKNHQRFLLDLLDNIHSVLETEDFVRLSPESILMLLNQTFLAIKESKLFLAVSKWVLHFFNEKLESRPKLVEDILSKIFFCEMSVEEFCKVNHSGLLTQVESFSIMRNLNKKNLDEQVPWPQGFRRCKRSEKYKINECESSVLCLPWESNVYYDRSSQYCEFKIVNILTPPNGSHQFSKGVKNFYKDTIKIFVMDSSDHIYSMVVENIYLMFGEEILLMFDRRVKLEKETSYRIRIKFQKSGARHCMTSSGVYFNRDTRFDFIAPFESRSHFPVKSIRFCKEFAYKL